MKWIETIRVAVRALAANKLRSFLTMLGVIIGVAATIALMSIGRGVETYIVEQFTGLGSNLLSITANQSRNNGRLQTDRNQPLLLSDAQAIGNPLFITDVAAVAAEYMAPATATRGDTTLRVMVDGATPNFSQVRLWQPILGTVFSQADFDEHSRVVVLGFNAYRRLFAPDEYPVDQTVQINGVLFRVIGVMEERGGGPASNLDDSIFMPLSTAHDRLFNATTVGGEYPVSVIQVSVVSRERMDAVQTQIVSLLRERRRISYLDDDDFTIVSQSALISVFRDILGALTLFLGAIAAISLLVGGIGIMNIMLVGVTERTHEIGLRKAIGAKRRDILFQFLMESVALTVVGWIFGVTSGVVGAWMISAGFQGFEAVVGIDAILLSLFLALAVGLFFGIYPAMRASQLNPIDALRHE
jgi:putative ABC transport system permease protein